MSAAGIGEEPDGSGQQQRFHDHIMANGGQFVLVRMEDREAEENENVPQQEQEQHQQQQQQQQQRPVAVYATTFHAMKEHKDHPLRMKLLWDELFRALDIKKAIEETPELDSISDFMCAHLALVCKDDIENALHRVEGLQDFRRNYGIVEESCQNGRRALRKLVQLLPNLLLSFDMNPLDGNYVLACDFSGMDSTSLTPTNMNDFFIGMYYLHVALHPDFYSIHKGPLLFAECKDMGWPRSQDLKIIQKLAFELSSIYPFTPTAKHYNTGAVFNIIFGTVKKLFPKETAKKFEVGLRFETGLRSIFLVPDAATARQRILHNLEEALSRRFDNENLFSLAKSHGESVVPSNDDEVEAVSTARGF